MSKIIYYHLYMKQLFSDETNTIHDQPWVYCGVVKESPKDRTTADFYTPVESIDLTGGIQHRRVT